MSIWVRLGGGTPATEIAAHSPPTWETLADGGSGECSFSVALSAKTLPPLLQKGTLLEILCGGSRLWLGRINDYDREQGQVIGRGMHTDAYQIPAIDGAGNVTRDVVTALNTAFAAPWDWFANNYNGVAGVATGDSDSPQMLGQLLDQYAAQLGMRWRQDTNASIFIGVDPTVPTYMAVPESAAFGETDESSPNHLIGRYFNGTANANALRWLPDVVVGRAEFRDLTDRGDLTLAQANAILDAELAANASRPSWINGVTLHREQLTTPGGTPAFLPAVAAGTMVRVHGLMADGVIQAPWLDVVIGKTKYTAGEDTIYLEPVNTAPRTLTSVIAAA